MLCYYEELMEVDVFFDEGLEGCLDADWLQDIAKQVLITQDTGNDVEMGLVIASQQRVQELNKTYRGKDMPTDVLSFAMHAESTDAPGAAFATPPDGIKHLGEVIISYPQASKQADEHHHSIKREVAILIIHGILHLLGYDHIEDDEAEKMEAKEAAILNGIAGEIK
ncbi:MAG: rRNA maturation RNase YbeY [Chloroflexota bacterium]